MRKAENKRKKVLIIDDESDLVRPIALRLKAAGWEVATAFSGEEGLERAAAFRPDAALVDISMPGIDGWHVARALRADPHTRGTKVIIMTAWVSPDLGRRAQSEGVARLLLKPFEEKELLAILEDGAVASKTTAGGPS